MNKLIIINNKINNNIRFIKYYFNIYIHEDQIF